MFSAEDEHQKNFRRELAPSGDYWGAEHEAFLPKQRPNTSSQGLLETLVCLSQYLEQI
jgi:hypothetical protein